MAFRLAARRAHLQSYVLLVFAASIWVLGITEPVDIISATLHAAHNSQTRLGAQLAQLASSTSADANAAAAAAAGGSGGAGDSDEDASGSVLRLLQAARQYRARVDVPHQLLRHRDVSRALYLGDQERIRSFVHRMADGQQLTIALLGGSVSKGMGAVMGEPSYEGWLAAWLAAVAPAPSSAAAELEAEREEEEEEEQGGEDRAGSRGWRSSTVRIVNAACPATSSAYMNMCLHEYLRDTDVDLILVEYAINDAALLEPPIVNEPRKSFEQLLRKLLRLPKRPAVVLLNMFRWFSQGTVGRDRMPSDSFYFTNAESDYLEFATYYGLPMISVKAAVYHHMVAGTHGFQVDTMRYLTRPNASADPEALFYEDPMHPSGLTGHRAISELVVGLLLHVARGLVARPWRQSEEELVVAPLPGHMIPNNYDSDLDLCILGNNLKAAAVELQGFSWVNEGRTAHAPKWGYTATAPNSTVVFSISSSGPGHPGAVAASHLEGPAAAAATGDDGGGGAIGRSVLIILAYLRSYTGMGVAAVSCEGGCECGGMAEAATAGSKPRPRPVVALLDGQWEHYNSQLQLGCFPARVTGPDCRVRVQVDDVGRNGTNKVKLGGIIVSHTAPEMAQEMCKENLEAAGRAAGYRDYRRL